jgi:hypothetical protein
MARQTRVELREQDRLRERKNVYYRPPAQSDNIFDDVIEDAREEVERAIEVLECI